MSQSEQVMFELLIVTSLDWLDPIRDWANRMRDCSGGHAKKFSLFFILNFKMYFNEYSFVKRLDRRAIWRCQSSDFYHCREKRQQRAADANVLAI